MGGASSKVKSSASGAARAARQQAAEAGVLPSAKSHPAPPPPPPTQRPPSSPSASSSRAGASAGSKASGSKTAAIEQDGQDPTFMRNLELLGQVAVPSAPSLTRSGNQMTSILSSRRAAEEASELAATSPSTAPSNRISAQSLSYLLDERKNAKSRQEVEKLAKEYGIQIEVLDDLARFVNAPSVSKVKSKREDLQETMLSRWVDPPPEVTRR